MQVHEGRKTMTEKHAKELQEFGQMIGTKVCIYQKGTGPLGITLGNFDGDVYVTFQDSHATDFPTAVHMLRRIQAENFPPDVSHLIY